MDQKQYNWGDVNVSETVSEQDQQASDSLSFDNFIGQALCTCVASNPVEKNFKNYSCFAASLQWRIDKVIECEQPLFNEDGKLVKKDGVVVQKVQPAKDDKFDTFFSGRLIFDEIPLYHPEEKEFFKKRRLFILKKAGVLNQSDSQVTTKHFQDIVGKQVLVRTERNKYTDKMGNEKENVRVMVDGYDFAKNAEVKDDDFSNI